MKFFLNQPNNLMINHLGKGSFWKFSETTQKELNYLSPLISLHFNKLIRIIFLSGIYFYKHLFFNKLFFKGKDNSMPIDFNSNLIKKFYREIRLKILINQGGKKIFFNRKLFQTLNISEISLLKKAELTLMNVDIHLPAPYKRIISVKKFKNKVQQGNSLVYHYILQKLWNYKFIKF